MKLLRRAVRKLLLSFLLVAACTGSAGSAHALAPLSAHLQVRFHGTSTLHDFEGTAAPVTVDLRPVAGSSDAAPLLSAEAVVPVATLDTGNDDRDTKMRKMLGAENHSEIRARFSRIDVGGLRAAASSGRAELLFELTIGDVTRDVVASVSQWQETSERATFDAAFHVSLEEFGLKRPSVLGLIRVGDQVDVFVRVVVEAR